MSGGGVMWISSGFTAVGGSDGDRFAHLAEAAILLLADTGAKQRQNYANPPPAVVSGVRRTHRLFVKHQAPKSKHQRSSKSQAPITGVSRSAGILPLEVTGCGLGAWNLVLGASLELGAWCLVL